MVGSSKLLGIVVAIAALLLAPSAMARVLAGPLTVDFHPHRAVYDITFDRATPGSGVADMNGRMVYEMTGSRCGGYEQNMRFVTRMTNQEGVAQVNDLRTTSFEDLALHRLRFSSSQYENQKLSEASQGSAGPGNGSGDGGGSPRLLARLAADLLIALFQPAQLLLDDRVVELREHRRRRGERDPRLERAGR